jgi:hypothetical protein
MSIPPSSLFGKRNRDISDFYNRSFKNYAIRKGVVLEVYEIEDENNLSKISPEYDVMTVEQDQSSGVNTTIYKNCVMMDGFGGVADFFQKKLRPVKDKQKTKSEINVENETGSIVTILCLDGISEKAIIVGSMSNPSKKVLTKEKGIHLEGEYNGINYKVNKDGELTVTFRSATNDDGTPKNEIAGGSFFKIDKTGSFEINDNNKDSIKIDKIAQTITLNSERSTSVVANANLNLTSRTNTNIKALDLVANAEARIVLNSRLPSSFKCSSVLTFEAPTVKIQGTNMIMAQASQIQLLGNQVIVGAAAVPAVIPTTTVLSIGNLGAPSIGTMIGPYSSSVLVGI